MSAYKMIAYHCRNCGGNTDPEKEYCDYCSGQLMLKRFIDSVPKTKKVRLLVACDNDYVNFDTIFQFHAPPMRTEFEVMEFSPTNYCMRPKQHYNEFSFDLIFNKRTNDLFSKLKQDKSYDMRIEYPTADTCFDFSGYTEMQLESIGGIHEAPIANLKIIQDAEMKMYDGIIPKNAYCPNCYAPITSRYGCCDYCGGWVEWVW